MVVVTSQPRVFSQSFNMLVSLNGSSALKSLQAPCCTDARYAVLRDIVLDTRGDECEI
jgi:hypothetical protein